MRVLSLMVAGAVVASGQTGLEVLKKVAETYRSLKSYQFEAQVVTETVSENSESRNRTTRSVAVVLPDRRRLEVKGGQTASVRVYDGQTVWEYRPGVKQFARHDQATYTPPRMNVLSDPVESYKILDKASGAKILREETVESGGTSHPCWVLEVPSRFPAGGFILERSPTTYWVDKTTNLILKISEATKVKLPNMDAPQRQTSTTIYTIARTNESIPEELFRFQPPKDAAEVSEFPGPFGTASTMAGKVAPAIVLQDLAGREVTLESFRGKPVIVSFWATWCAPCRAQMPKILEAQRTFADKGLVVLAINYGESRDVAKQYIEEHNYPFQVLLDPDKALGGKYSITTLPALFLIDGEGKIRAQFTGYNDSLDLREELKRIGI